MIVNINTQRNKYPKSVIFAIEQNDDKDQIIKQIAEQFGVADTFKKDFKANLKETLTLYTHKGKTSKIHLIGLGKNPSFIKICQAFRNFGVHHGEKLSNHFGIETNTVTHEKFVEAAVNGLVLSTYNFHLYRTDE